MIRILISLLNSRIENYQRPIAVDERLWIGRKGARRRGKSKTIMILPFCIGVWCLFDSIGIASPPCENVWKEEVLFIRHIHSTTLILNHDRIFSEHDREQDYRERKKGDWSTCCCRRWNLRRPAIISDYGQVFYERAMWIPTKLI